MAEKSNVFPTIIRAEYDPANAFPKMIADAKGAAGQIKSEFSKALGTGLTVSGTKGVFDGLAAEAARLRSAIDPLYSAQTKFNQAMNSAETLARAGVISENELTQATRLYREELQRANAALFENAKASNAARSAASSPIRQKSGAEILVGGGATIDRAAISATTLDQVLSRVATKGKSVQVAMAESARATDQYEASLRELRSELDHTYYSAQKLADGIKFADLAFSRGHITLEQHTQRHAQLQASYKQSVESSRQLRQASVQAGQQMQDVAISLYSGQNASVVFAQQLPQLAFALSGLEGSANKTHNRIGQFATFLSGPWGLAVGLGIGVLAQLVTSLISSGDEADKTGSAVDRLGNKLDIAANSYRALIDVVNEYNKAQSNASAVTFTAIRSAENAARDELESLQSQLAKAKDKYFRVYGNNAPKYFGTEVIVLQERLKKAEQALRDAGAAVGGERVKRQTDRRYDIDIGFQERIFELTERRKKGLVDQVIYEQNLLALQKQRTAALEDFDEAQKKAAKTGRTAANGAPTIAEVSNLLTRKFGGTITSTTGGKHTAGSDHYKGGAVDFVPAGGMSSITKADIRNALAAKGLKPRVNAKGVEQLFGPGDPGHADHFHVAWDRARLSAEDAEEASGKAAKAAQAAMDKAAQLSEFGQDAGDRIASIANNFDETPPAVARANEALARMADLSTDIDKKLKEGLDPKVAEALKASIAGLEPIIRNSVAQPIRDMLDDTEKNVAVLDLLIAGREIEAEVLRRKYQLETNTRALTEGEVGQIRDSLTLEREKTRELEKQNGIRQREVALLDETQNNLKQLTFDVLKGNGVKGIGAALSRQSDAMLSNMADNLSESLFGDFFRDQKDKALGFDKVKDASVDVSKGLDKATVAANDFATALGQTIADIRADALGENGVTANDNDGEIVVIGKLEPKTPSEIRREKSLTTSALTSALGDRFGKTVQSAVQNGFTGALVGGLIGGKTGRAVGGGLSSLATLAASAGGQGGKLDSFFQALNQASPVIAATMAINDIANSVLGNDQIKGGNTFGKISPLFTALFGKARKGSATIGGVGSSLGITGVTGNSNSRKQAASDSANSIIGIIEGIADSFAGAFNASAGSVSIGVRKKSYVLDPTGQGRTKGAGTINFGSDQEAAMRAAVLDLIRDGVISGLRAGTQTLIQATGDLEKQLQKAAKFEGVFASLKAIKDPVGSALETLNKEFTSLIGVFKEAGATTAEWAQLEEYYGLKREEVIKQTTDALTSALKNLLSDLEIGDNGLSLNDRLANARTVYDPLAAKIRNGETVNYDAFAEAARSVIDISRQIYGSQDDYFAMFNEVTGLTRKALSDQQNIISIASGTASPFSASATPSLDNTPVVAAIDGQSQMLLTQLLGLNTTNGKILNAIEAANNNGTGSALFNGVFGLQANTYF